jgi:hypothetical protein
MSRDFEYSLLRLGRVGLDAGLPRMQRGGRAIDEHRQGLLRVGDA